MVVMVSSKLLEPFYKYQSQVNEGSETADFSLVDLHLSLSIVECNRGI